MPIGVLQDVLRREVGDRVYFFGTITSDLIRDLTFVPVIERSPKTPLIENTDEGYQRPGTQARMNKFRNFLKDNPNSVVPPVLLSGRGNWRFTPDVDGRPYGRLEIHGSAAILDGQHRLGGYVLLNEQDHDVRKIDFLLVEQLSHAEELKEFVIVNNTQVGVPKSLNFFLAQDVPGLESIVGDFSDETWIAWQLNIREDSPFQGRITRTKMGPEHVVQLHSAAKSIERMFKDGAFEGVDREVKLDIAIRYWTLIQSYHALAWADIEKLGVPGQGRKAFEYKLLELTGFIAWSLIANSRIISTSYNASSHTVDWDRVERMIETLSDKVDWRKDGTFAGFTGEVGGPRIQSEMQLILAQNPL